MPRIPKKVPIFGTKFPQPMYRSATGEYNRYNPTYAKAFEDDLGLEMVQGPDMPWALENRRQVMRDAQERFEAEMATERERQLLNRRAQVWNEYAELPRRERQFYANRDGLARYLFDYEYIPDELEAWKATRSLPALDRWSRRNLGKAWPMQDLGQYEGPVDFPPEFIDEPPWRY